MQERSFGACGSVVVVGQGTWQLEEASRAGVVRTLRAGLDAGMTHVDTAELYGRGVVEEMVGEALAGRRDEVFLVSKVLPENASRAGTIAACERSLRRLRTERLDVYLLHWRGRHPLAETVAAFDRLVAEGKIAAWGVSNFDEDDLAEVAALGTPACNQVLYHLEERAIEHAVLPWCRAHEVAMVGYSPFGSGAFPSPRSAGGRVLQTVADAHGVSPFQVALAFLVREPGTFTIPRASSVAHAQENAAAGDLRLTAGEIARIDAAFPRGRRRRGVPTL
ncbi:MAG: aldo/keto reductase [bacterium]|nr:aldo/keto reductase [bacterium]